MLLVNSAAYSSAASSQQLSHTESPQSSRTREPGGMSISHRSHRSSLRDDEAGEPAAEGGLAAADAGGGEDGAKDAEGAEDDARDEAEDEDVALAELAAAEDDAEAGELAEGAG